MNLFFDIETIPTQHAGREAEICAPFLKPEAEIRTEVELEFKKPETIEKHFHARVAAQKPKAEEAYRKTSLDGTVGEVWCIGFAFDDEPADVISRASLDDREDLVLETFFQIIRSREPKELTFIGHNVRDFDLRFLYHRSVILNTPPGFHLPHDSRHNDMGHPFWSVYDTMLAWVGGYKGTVSLDALCRSLGIQTKGDITGANVWDAVKAGRIADVAQYCCDDVDRTREVFKRLTFADYKRGENHG